MLSMKILKQKKSFLPILRDTEGASYPLISVMIIVFAMIFSVVLIFAGLVVQINTMKENSKVVLDSFVVTNATGIYDSIKNGNNQISEIDTDDYCNALKKYCTFDEKDNLLYNNDKDGREMYHITKPTLTMVNDGELELKLNYTMSIPIKFSGIVITTATIPIEIISNLTEKF